MESSTILTADVLDIIFEGRNKDYGAYDLRRTYKKRLTVSITVMLSVICMLSLGFAFAGKKSKEVLSFVKDIQLAAVEPPQSPVEPPPPPLKQPPPPVQVQTLRVTPPRIVPDEQVTKDEMPPVAEQEHVKIGTENKDGIMDGDLVAPPASDGVGKGIIETPKKEEEDGDGILLKVEIESEYPGGPAAWQRFLYKNLRYPNEAMDQAVQGTVLVQFIVDKEGNVSNVEAVSGPQELRAEAIRVIKKSGKWTPAVQNGRHVKSYKKQPIGFRFNEE